MVTDFKTILSRLGKYRMLNMVVAINITIFLLIPVANLIATGLNHSSFEASTLLALHAGWGELSMQIWSLITYMFTQTNFLHLLFNLLWLYGFGIVLSDLRGDTFFLVTFLVSGILGGVGYLLTSSSGDLLGCSAASLGVMTACGAAAPNMEVRLYGFWKMRMIWIVALGVVISMLGSVSNPASAAAHLGGLIGGTVIILMAGNSIKTSSSSTASYPSGIRLNGNKVAKALSEVPSNPERLDQLLDKIRISGYSSLSPSERSELARLSSKIREQ